MKEMINISDMDQALQRETEIRKTIEEYAPVLFTLQSFIEHFIPIYVEVGKELGHYSKHFHTKRFLWKSFKPYVSTQLKKLGYKNKVVSKTPTATGRVYPRSIIDSFTSEEIRHIVSGSVWVKE